MSKRRMFSHDIVGSDVFVDMPLSSQALYFHLCMNADDDGFISRPKQICRMVNASDDDLKILVAKRFVLVFDSGVAVVKQWLVHNLIRADLYKETTYKTEKGTLGLNEYGAYTELRDGVIPLQTVAEPNWLKRRKVNNVSPKSIPKTVRKRYADGTDSAHRLGKDRLGKDSISKSKDLLVNSDKPSSRMSGRDFFQKLVEELGFSDRVQPTDGRLRKMKVRLNKFTPKQLIEAARIVKADDYMQGDNKDGKRYGTIDYLLRSDENIAKWLEQDQELRGGKESISKYV